MRSTLIDVSALTKKLVLVSTLDIKKDRGIEFLGFVIRDEQL